jgi:hypothetical protein
VRSSHHSAKISGQREPPIGRLLSINCGRKPSCQGIIRYLDTTTEAIDVIIRKLVSYIDIMDKGIEILQLENIELRNGAADRRAKKKKKRVVLSTKSVLTTK